MCVLCMFYDDLGWEDGKNFRAGIFLSKNLVGLHETNKFLLGLILIAETFGCLSFLLYVIF